MRVDKKGQYVGSRGGIAQNLQPSMQSKRWGRLLTGRQEKKAGSIFQARLY